MPGRESDKQAYSHVKDYIENELGIKEGTIEKIFDKIIERAIEKRVDRMFNTPAVARLISETLSKALTENENYYGHVGLSPEAKKLIRKNINDFLMKEIKEKLVINSINVLIE